MFRVLRYFSIVSGVLIVGVGGLILFTFLTVEAGEREALEASHQDIHILGAHIDYSIRTVVTVLVLLLGALYGVLFLIVARADRVLRSQYNAIADREILLQRKNGELERAVAALQRAQLANESAQHLAALSQLMPAVSHELRNPLGAMRSATFLVRNLLHPDQEDAKRAAASLDRCITRCDRIIDKLMDVAKLRLSDPRPLVLDTWLRQIVAEHPAPAGVKVEVDAATSGALLSADADLLRRAVDNVLENAFQAITETAGGESRSGGGTVRVSTHRDHARIEIEISDDGHGIEENVLPRVFEPMFSTRGFGVGLGLTMVRWVMEHHHGGVELWSDTARGTKVTLWLPSSAQISVTPVVAGAA